MTADHSGTATRENSRVAFVTCAELPDLDPDDRLARDALRRLGVTVDPVVWDRPGTAWDRYDLVVLRSPWDYPERRPQFLTWAAGVPRLANPADVVAWNTDKRYLAELAAAGLAVVPTVWVHPGDDFVPPPVGEYVVKPAVSAGSRDTGRYDLADRRQRALAEDHVARLRDAGRTVMVQPYLSAVDAAGETALIFLPDGGGGLRFSHAIRKAPMLTGPDAGPAGLYRPESISARTPGAAELAVAERVVAGIPGGADRLLYARVDLIPGSAGEPVLLELELTEPSLFFGFAAGAVQRFASAIVARLNAG